MRRVRLIPLCVAIAVTLASCSKLMDVAVSGDTVQRLVFTVTNRGERDAKRVCVDQLTVRSPDRGWHEGVLWDIQSSNGDCVWLRSLTYGELPAGFMAMKEPVALHEGETYDVFARGWTRGLASAPWGGGGSVMFVEGRWSVIR